MTAPPTPDQAERTLHAGLMNVLLHTEGFALYQAKLSQRIDALMLDLCDPSREFADTQRLRGHIIGLREALNLPDRLIREAKP